MEIRYYSKASAYESLFRKSVTNPESTGNLKYLNAYRQFYYSTYKHPELVPRQLEILKRLIFKTIEKLSKQSLNKTNKIQLWKLLPELEHTWELSQMDKIVNKALDLSRSSG